MKLNYKINLQLTQTSGQTSQPPWKLVNDEYCTVSLINEIPVLLKVSQANLDSFEVNYELLNENQIGDKGSLNIKGNLDVRGHSNVEGNLEVNNGQNINEKMIFDEIAKLYGLNFDLNKFYKFLSKDEKLKSAINFCNGLRLFLAKDYFESIISSISSANNSIIRWTKSIDAISSNWGKVYNFPSGTFYTFPNPKTLSNIYEGEIAEIESNRHINNNDNSGSGNNTNSNDNINSISNNKSNIININNDNINNKYANKENCNELAESYVNNLRSCGLGYRASYIKKASEIFSSKLDPLDISYMKYDEAFETLVKIPGIGPKVADCILLYGYGFMEAFPSDVWIKRIISYLYFDGKDIKVEKIRNFGMDEFKNYAGYTQLYLFHFARKSGLMSKLKPRK
ncbi:MAG: 3-methyladenine DNA glycosylase [Methanobrevibacter sp.]|jgi:N-glycosylase/DNA lyase|nr:3-methyladenine DNA glycosylase [Candidatus Methanovirga procula]